jgi:hypothetical protein
MRLRGGTSFVSNGNEFIGFGHAIPIKAGKIYYLHRLVQISQNLEVLSIGDPIFLHRRGIEFACGLALDQEMVHVSYGVSDHGGYLMSIDARNWSRLSAF